MGDSPKRTSLYVDNLHPEVEEKDLKITFGTVGPLVSVTLRRYETPRELLCCAVVNFCSHTDACTALESLNRTELRGKPIRILWEDDERDCDHVDYEEEEGSEGKESSEEKEDGEGDCDHVDYEEEEVPEGEKSSEEEEDDEGDCDHVDYDEEEGCEEEESLEECEFSEEGSEDYQDDSYDYTKDPSLIQTAEDELADLNPDWFLKQLVGKGLAAAAIYTLDCGVLLDDRGGFPVLTKDEFREINRVIDHPPSLTSELSLGGQSHQVTENGPLGFLLSMEGAARGCAVKKTNKLLVFGYYQAPTTAEQCAEAVHTVGKEILYHGF